ncbi:MAG: aldo/keto reductase [Chthoniobacteraceae bacterium]
MTPATFLIGGDLPVHRVGYGAMRLCGQPGNFGPFADWNAGEKLLRRAVELGVNFFDTAEAYGPGNNEEIIAAALHPYREGLVITTKGGVTKTSPINVFPDGRPENLRRACEDSLRRLRMERIDLYQLHRPDPKVPFADSVGTLAALRAGGKIRHVGLSNVTVAQIEEAVGIVPIFSVQNRYNLRERGADDVLAFCERHGIAFLPYGPLGAQPFERHAPLSFAESPLTETASRLGATPAQLALAWLLRRSPNIIVIPGTTTIPHLEENIGAAKIDLSDADFTLLAALKTE